MSPEFWQQLIANVGIVIGLYAGIRADLARLHERTTNHAEQLRDIWSELK